MPSTTADIVVAQPDANNDDARSTSSTLVSGEGKPDDETDEQSQTPTAEQVASHLNATSLEDPISNVRHGFDDQIYEEELIRYMYYTERRHETDGKPSNSTTGALQDWRLRERIKTVWGLLIVCLNIGTDPPDVVKTNPCAKLECWIDPFSQPPPKALESIGKNLQSQYEIINMRTRFKQSLDPSVEETKKLCCQMRRNAKQDRILFHYNGHGVPKPTASGEIWVFNKTYTQYIPVSLFDLQSWLGAPVIYVWDCSSAGNIIHSFNRFAEQRDNEALRLSNSGQSLPTATSHMRDCIQLAACGPNETLPMNPNLPADLFTACLTTPIEMSLRWVIIQNPLLASDITLDMILKLPGRAQERRTPLGELTWIFTAVTDTIAWCVLQDQPDLFKRLFRQDLMVASMFRNFLLAERIMRSHRCTPLSVPKLPQTHDHPMWQAWDLAVDMCLLQLPALLQAEKGRKPYHYQSSNFFAEQLTAFEVWLTKGAAHKQVPEQLPIVLQVLLSQVHRLRALILLSRFLDLGPWAVNAALSVGIFPYVLKLLQSPAAELKPVLVFIWARILAVDKTCQGDLLKDHVEGYAYFINILAPNNAMLTIPHVSEHRAMSAFILSVFCHNYKVGQQHCLRANVINACLEHVNDPDPLLRQWVCLCLSQLWMNNSEAKASAIAQNAHERLCNLLTDKVTEVRASAMYALETFLGDVNKTEQVVNIEHNVAISALVAMSDGSPIVRKEFVIALSHIVHQSGHAKFVAAATQTVEEETAQRAANHLDERAKLGRNRNVDRRTAMDGMFSSTSHDSVYAVIWKALLNLSVDPHPDVAQAAQTVVDYVNSKLLTDNSTVSDYASSLAHKASSSVVSNPHLLPDRSQSFTIHEDKSSAAALRRPAKLTRSASFAQTLRSLYNLGSGTLSSAGSDSSSPGSITGVSVTAPNGALNGSQNGGLLAKAASVSAGIDQPPHIYIGNMDKERKQEIQDGQDVLPLKSDFYDWSCEYFTEPQMRAAEADEPGSISYTQRKWRRTRNEKILNEAQSMCEVAGVCRWDEPFRTFGNDSNTTKLLFHQFEPHLISADAHNTISVWNWKTSQQLSIINNHNPRNSRITDLKFINEDDVAMLLTASDDGVIRIYKGYDEYDKPDSGLVTAWRALKGMEKSSSKQSGMVCDWYQNRGTLLIGGDARVIKVWDAQQELVLTDIPLRSSACVTSITSDQTAGNIFIAGFGDGSIRIFDRRLPPQQAVVQEWSEHNAWVTNVQLQRNGNRELVSGSYNGDIKIWDIRLANSIRTILSHKNTDMTALALHDHAPVVATGSDDHSLKVWNVNGTNLSTIRPTGWMNQRFRPIHALAFHPNMMMLASSSFDGNIAIHGCDTNNLIVSPF
ncbi:unnamed protein product [Umbelopsis sp. WA50703]